MMHAAYVSNQYRTEYERLLSATLPFIVETEEQNEAYLRQVADLLRHEDSLNDAQREFVRLLTLLIEDFEEKHYTLPKASPAEAIAFLMDQQGLKQKDLLDVFGSHSITSEVLSGKRDLSKTHIRRLSERFHVSPEIFF